MKKIRIKLIHAVIGRNSKQRGTVKALGLKRMNSCVEKEVSPVVMGMVNRISHLVKVEEIN